MPKIKQTAHRATSSQLEIKENDDFVAEEEEIQPEEASGSHARKRRRTPAEIAVDKRRTWEGSFNGRKFKKERQVDVKKFKPDHMGVRCIIQKGLQFWTECLVGYNRNAIIESYKYMQIPEGDWENHLAVKITSQVGGIDVEITPNDIAREKGVKGWAYEKLQELSPGPFDDAFDEKSLSQTHARRNKQESFGLCEFPSVDYFIVIGFRWLIGHFFYSLSSKTELDVTFPELSSLAKLDMSCAHRLTSAPGLV
ncbi:hypothetical protein RHMOL_Rhmol01G0126100 [Rhododendron molle]|uniref:Uncharacterized protein n=1 Tax=Rhododendron molle TaxID=49168 RepID=A0ACC0Q0N3_RHOML|nr:hypothetical protein RHMOL_Rhmol01G0126100 [Rhododendron molle]